MTLPVKPPAIRSSGRWVWVAFFVLVVVPLYAIAVTMCIRSGLFRFDRAPLGNEQLKAIWTFLAAGLTAAVTLLGALLTKSHNDRTLAFQVESAERQRILEAETNERLSMDTVINGLNLICHDGNYSPRAAAAGGLATLVQLGHPIVAMRALAAALPDGAVDNSTATWLISQVLTTTTTRGTSSDLSTAKLEAADLLGQYAPKLTVPTSKDADYAWPGAVTTQWPSGLPQNAGLNILAALTELLLSQSKEWWESTGHTFSWILYTLDEAIRHDKSPTVRMGAAILGQAMLDVSDDMIFSGVNDTRERSQIVEDIRGVDIDEDGLPRFGSRIERIQAWGQGGSTPLSAHPTPSPNP